MGVAKVILCDNVMLKSRDKRNEWAIFFHLHRKSCCMERLLVFLFSITLLLATSPPREVNGAYDYSGGICIAKKSSSAASAYPKEQPANQNKCDKHGQDDCGEESGCPLPMCCFFGPCCCLCRVPNSTL